MPGEKKVKDVINAQFTAMQQHKEFIQKEHLPDMPWKWNLHVQEKYQTDRDELTHRMSVFTIQRVLNEEMMITRNSQRMFTTRFWKNTDWTNTF